jgi:hypothetical protein
MCHGRAGASRFFIDRGDGVCRDDHGRVMSDAPDVWTCAGCGRTYTRTRIIIRVEGRSQSVREQG